MSYKLARKPFFDGNFNDWNGTSTFSFYITVKVIADQ